MELLGGLRVDFLSSEPWARIVDALVPDPYVSIYDRLRARVSIRLLNQQEVGRGPVYLADRNTVTGKKGMV